MTRIEPPEQGDERSTLIGFLNYQRQTLLWKCSDLTGVQLATQATPPSQLSLLGLLRHLAEVEHSWAEVHLAERDVPALQ